MDPGRRREEVGPWRDEKLVLVVLMDGREEAKDEAQLSFVRARSSSSLPPLPLLVTGAASPSEPP